MIYPIFKLQKDLGNMYRHQYKTQPITRAHLLEMGYAIKRLLERKDLSPFDNYEKVKEMIFREMDFSKIKYEDETDGIKTEV